MVEVQTWTPLENSTMQQHFWPPRSVFTFQPCLLIAFPLGNPPIATSLITQILYQEILVHTWVLGEIRVNFQDFQIP
jgi:hypothetical protein